MRGGKRTGAGRKKGKTGEDVRGLVKQVRWTSGEWSKISTAANRSGISIAAFIRNASLLSAEEVSHGL